MTREELSTEHSCFAALFDTSDEVLPFPETPLELTLDPYLDSLSPNGSRAHPSDDQRRLELEHILKKLSSLEIIGKEYVEGYFRHQYRSHFQSNTLRNTYNCLVPFLRFIKRRGKRDIEEVERGDLEGFIEHEQDRGLKVSTVKLKLAKAKAFLRYMVNEGVLREDVFPWKLKIKLPETLPRAMDPDDVERLLEVKGSVRDRAMVLVLLRTGMRIGELLNTRVSDVYMEEQKILIYEGAKNQRGRVVYFSEDAKDALKEWMHTRDRRTELIFYGYKGKPLSYAAARMMFMRYLERAELSHKGYTLHCLRHTYATELLNARMPLECLEKLLGHTHLEVTRRYARLRDKTKEEEYFKAMAIIERREKDGYYECDRELQTILETTQLLTPHGEELHEHP
jgi:site-specific recombinase XerD